MAHMSLTAPRVNILFMIITVIAPDKADKSEYANGGIHRPDGEISQPMRGQEYTTTVDM